MKLPNILSGHNYEEKLLAKSISQNAKNLLELKLKPQ
jgi:hypothetical protein